MSNPELHSYQVAMVVSTKIAEITSAIRNEKKTHGTLRFDETGKKSSLVNGERWTQVLVKLLKSNGQIIREVEGLD